MVSAVLGRDRESAWRTVFGALVVTQGAHVAEHVVQMVQIHALGVPKAMAHGVVGALDVEWVHFAWNTAVLGLVAVLTWRYRRNPWLWAALVAAGWHEAEHVYLVAVYLATGRAGDPGLLAQGGLLAGGLPVDRPTLHLLYNLLETVPLLVAFLRRDRGVSDVALASLPLRPRT